MPVPEAGVCFSHRFIAFVCPSNINRFDVCICKRHGEGGAGNRVLSR